MIGTRWAYAAVTVLVLAGVTFAVLRPQEVEVVHPWRGAVVQTVVASGQVLPPAEIKLGALVSSTALEVHVREGDLIKRGQLLLQLDDAEAQAALNQAKASLAAAAAGRSEMTTLSAPAAEARLIEAEARLSQAKTRLTRETNLTKAGVSTAEVLDDARTAVALATAQKQAADLQVKAASSGGSQSLGTSANVAVAQAQVALAEEQLKRHSIHSPSDGVVLARSVEPGDAVLSGASLFVLSATGATRVRIEPDERNLALLELGQKAIASTEAFPERQFAAKLGYIAPSVNPQRGTVEVRLDVPEPPDYLRAHMTVSVEIEVAHARDGLLVPRGALRNEALSPQLLVVTNGRVTQRPVKLGVRGDSLVEVRSGVQASDAVVATPDAAHLIGARVKALLSSSPHSQD